AGEERAGVVGQFAEDLGAVFAFDDELALAIDPPARRSALRNLLKILMNRKVANNANPSAYRQSVCLSFDETKLTWNGAVHLEQTLGRDFSLERRRSRGRTLGARGGLGGRRRRRRCRQRPLSLNSFQEFPFVVKGANLELGR